MIDTVEIRIHNGVFNRFCAFIDYKQKNCYINEKNYKVSDEFLEKLKKILYSFQKEYGDINIIDAEEFQITVTSNKKQDVYHGKGVFPPNYQELINLLEVLR